MQTSTASVRRRNWPGWGLMSCLILTALASLFSSNVFAQSDNAQIAGFVKDAAGAATPGVRVKAKSESKEFERSSTTNNEGYYVIPNLPPGLYTVTAELPGFKRYEETNKKVDP